MDGISGLKWCPWWGCGDAAEAAQPTCPMVLPVGGFGLILHLLLCKKISQDPNDFSELKRGQLD